jgi:hypothetical protein
MKRTDSDVLLVGSYTGRGATREQFIKTFATADIRVGFPTTLRQRERARPPCRAFCFALAIAVELSDDAARGHHHRSKLTRDSQA